MVARGDTELGIAAGIFGIVNVAALDFEQRRDRIKKIGRICPDSIDHARERTRSRKSRRSLIKRISFSVIPARGCRARNPPSFLFCCCA